jgi:hypothetical protein
VPGTGRGRLKVLRYEERLQIYQDGQLAIEYALAPDGVRNQQIDPPDKPASGAHPRHRPQPSHEEEKRLRALHPSVSAYVDFLLATPGHLRHQTLRRLWTLSQRMSAELFVRAVTRAHRYRVHDLRALERIAQLYLQESPHQLPLPAIDESFRDRPAYQQGSLTETPNLSGYDD